LTHCGNSVSLRDVQKERMKMAERDIAVGLRGVSKSYGRVQAVAALDLDVMKGDFLAILGPSGCGKTTLLRMIGGFVTPSTGRILVAGQDVTEAPPERRPTNMVFQGYGLFPHMNVRQNIAYGLTLRKLPKAEVDARVGRMLALVRLEAMADRMGAELSGGQQQRVAVARALVMEPPVLLLDEPFAALDLKLRQAMQEELRRIHREVGGTFVFVTHDQTEALALASRIAVMNEGRLEQIGTPRAMYLAPATRFVAQFVGEASVLAGNQAAGTLSLAAGATLPHVGTAGPVVLVLRPEAVQVEPAGGTGMLAGKVADVTFFGSHVRYGIALGSGEVVQANVPLAAAPMMLGQPVSVSWAHEEGHVLPA